MTTLLRCAVLALLLIPGFGAAQDLGAGLEAANSGDYETALREWRPLAERGDARAQFNLGVMYYKGQGVAQDHAEAVRWYRMAAEQGHAGAQTTLGVMYDAGQGVARDYIEAARWYHVAAEQGNAAAQFNLGLLYVNGDGVVQDYATAHMWFNIAAANGDEEARANRERMEEHMTADAIADAQRRARLCMSSGYEACD